MSNDKSDREMTEDEFVTEHTAHMGHTPEVVAYLGLRHQYLLRKATWQEVTTAYNNIDLNLRKKWRPIQPIAH